MKHEICWLQFVLLAQTDSEEPGLLKKKTQLKKGMNDGQFSEVFISRMSVEEALLASWPKSNLVPKYKLRSIRMDH